MFLRLYRQVVHEDGVTPSVGVAVRDCMAVPALPLVSSIKPTEEQVLSNAQVLVEHRIGCIGLAVQTYRMAAR